MKKRILSIVTAFFIMLMGIIKYPVFSFANNYIFGIDFTTANDRAALSFSIISYPDNASNVYVFRAKNGSTWYQFFYYFGTSSGSMSYTINRSNGNLNRTVYFNNYKNNLYFCNNGQVNAEADSQPTNIPYYDLPYTELLEALVNGYVEYDDLGYLKNVGYHVDAYGLENNPVGTNELITWDQESTTGIDLTQSNYSVEFAIRDNSYQYRRTYSDMMVQDSTTTQDLFQNPINTGFAYAMDFVTFLSSYVYPSGSNQRNLAQGRAVKAPSNGKSIGLGTFPARNKKASFNAFSKYSLYANSSGDTDFKNYLDRVIDSSTRYDYYENAKNFYNDTAPNYFSYGISYDIMARIVDTSNGNKGDWLIINKHNTPYIQSDTENRLAGAVTVQPSIINNFDPQVDVVVDVPDIEIDNNIDFRPIIRVGYVEAQPNVTIEEGDIITINNNYEYTYEGDNIYNNIEEITNIYDDGDGGDGSGDVSDPDNPLGGIKQGLIVAKKFIKSLVGWFRKIFNPFLPIWAQNVVIIAIPITVFGIIWKMVKPLLSLLGRELLPLLIEFWTGLPRLPG